MSVLVIIFVVTEYMSTYVCSGVCVCMCVRFCACSLTLALNCVVRAETFSWEASSSRRSLRI